ncbi:MAG: hypothetical protein PWQ37_2903 [Candidatus Petromonas sp.]|jgi:cellulose biosynthesis protein BcsQ|nr:hypothetical protein [Candidatus Petromonas sp.]
MKVFLAVGNDEIEEVIRECSFEIVDSENNLVSLIDLLDYISLDAVIINRLLDDDGKMVLKLAEKAHSKGVKILVLVNDFNDYEERKLITNLVNLGVTAFLKITEISKEKIENILYKYPEEFDFSVFSEPKIEVVEKVKSVFKEIITVYSPLSQGATTVASHLAVKLAKSKNCRVCIVDYNPLKPRFKYVFDTDFEYTLRDVLDAVERKNLSYHRLESFTKPSKYQRNLDILPGIYDINDYYMSKEEYYIEILEKLKFIYDYVVIDTHSWYDVITTDAALKFADKVLIPVIGKDHEIDELNRYIEMFEKYNDFDVRKFYAVINKYSGNDLTFIEIESKLKIKIAGYISKDKAFEGKNFFKNKRRMNEFADILKGIGIEAKKEKVFMDYIKLKKYKKKKGEDH